MACSGLHPRVGIFAIICDDSGLILTGRRIGALDPGCWGFPGGHLEQNEDFFSCVERETLEETGLSIRGVRVVGVTNDRYPEVDKHYVSIFIKCERKDPQQQPQRLEPNKCEGWTWKHWDEIKGLAYKENGPRTRELFLPIANLVRDNPQIDDVINSCACKDNSISR